jgi:hypothetical protein
MSLARPRGLSGARAGPGALHRLCVGACSAGLVPSVRRDPAGPQEEAASRELDDRRAHAAAAGRRAFAELHERYAQRLYAYAYCWKIAHDEVSAQDVLQTTCLNALVALRGQRRTAPMRPWLFRIAHNEAISMLRRLEPMHGAVALGNPSNSAEVQALRRERLHQVLIAYRPCRIARATRSCCASSADSPTGRSRWRWTRRSAPPSSRSSRRGVSCTNTPPGARWPARPFARRSRRATGGCCAPARPAPTSRPVVRRCTTACTPVATSVNHRGGGVRPNSRRISAESSDCGV